MFFSSVFHTTAAVKSFPAARNAFEEEEMIAHFIKDWHPVLCTMFVFCVRVE